METIVNDIDIPQLRPDAMSVDNAITVFATTTSTLPAVPLVWCLANWNQAGPPLLSLLQRYADGSDRSERTTAAALFCIYLTAGAREKRAFAPLCLLARDAEAMELALGDAVTESFQNILISTFDGNTDLLKGVIEDGSIDDFIRSSALQAIAYLAAAGEIDRTETEAYLGTLSDTLNAVPGEFVWSAWAEAIAMLGLERLKPLIRLAYDDGRVAPEISEFDWYERMMGIALEGDDPLSIFHDNNIRVITDIGAEFDGWYAFSEERRRDDREREAGFPYPDFHQPAPALNPYRSVGRNDPCPCGSGKKFKKCCLN